MTGEVVSMLSHTCGTQHSKADRCGWTKQPFSSSVCRQYTPSPTHDTLIYEAWSSVFQVAKTYPHTSAIVATHVSGRVVGRGGELRGECGASHISQSQSIGVCSLPYQACKHSGGVCNLLGLFNHSVDETVCSERLVEHAMYTVQAEATPLSVVSTYQSRHEGSKGTLSIAHLHGKHQGCCNSQYHQPRESTASCQYESALTCC